MLDPNAIPSSIVRPVVENHDDYKASFLEKCDTIKIEKVSNDAICLCLFSLSLKDMVKSWLMNSNAKSVTMWKGLLEAFLCK